VVIWKRRVTSVLGLLAILLVLGLRSASADPLLYVTHFYDGLVSVIDVATGTVVATITVGGAPWSVAMTPDGSRAYVANYGSPSIAVIDTTSNAIIGTVNVGGSSNGVVVSPDGTRAYVAVRAIQTVAVLDTSTNAVLAQIPVSSAEGPTGVTISPDGTRVYAATYGGDTVSVIDTAANSVVATVPLPGEHPFWAAVSPDGRRVYVTDYSGNAVTVISATTNTVIARIPVASTPRELAVTPDGKHLYAGISGANQVTVIDTATNAPSSYVYGVVSSLGVAATADGSSVYVAMEYAPFRIAVIDTTTNAIASYVPSPFSPWGLAFKPSHVNHRPVTVAALSGPAGNNGWYLGPVTVTLSASDPDGATDIVSTQFSVDGAVPVIYTTPFVVSGDGVHQITFWSVDHAGAQDAPHPSQTINIDSTAPKITASAFVTITVAGKMTDVLSGFDPSTAAFQLTDEDGVVRARGPVTVQADGSYVATIVLPATRGQGSGLFRRYQVTVTVRDKAGNLASTITAVKVPLDGG